MKAKYDDIGINYNETRSADPYIAERLLKNLNPKTNGLYLDIGCGTGNYTNELQKKGFNFIGIDPSKKMLEKARRDGVVIDLDRGYEMKPCPIGVVSACCKHCYMGPCRLNPKDPYKKVGICGATIDTIEARTAL